MLLLYLGDLLASSSSRFICVGTDTDTHWIEYTAIIGACWMYRKQKKINLCEEL
jgi:hypothetical protein